MIKEADASVRYRPAPPALSAVGLWVAGAGSSGWAESGGVSRPRRLLGHAVVLIERGAGRFASAPTSEVTVNAPCLLWLFPDTTHRYWPDPGWSHRWLLFAGPLSLRYRAAGMLDPARAVQALEPGMSTLAAFHRADDAYQADDPAAVATSSGALHELLAQSHARSWHDRTSAGYDAAVQRAIEMIDHQRDASSPEAIAAAVGMPYSTLRRRFRAATGSSIRDWMIERRLAQAEELLVGSRLPIHRLDGRCGFEDPYYFSRLFGKRVGVSASTFRRTAGV